MHYANVRDVTTDILYIKFNMKQDVPCPLS